MSGTSSERQRGRWRGIGAEKVTVSGREAERQ